MFDFDYLILLRSIGILAIIISIPMLLIEQIKKYLSNLSQRQSHESLARFFILSGAGSDRSNFSELSDTVEGSFALSKSAYDRGRMVSAAFVSIVIGMITAVFAGPVMGLCVTVVCGGLIFWLLDQLARAEHRADTLMQARQFPYFVDIFHLIASAGGDIGEAIQLYSYVYGHDALGRELAILLENREARSDTESLTRLARRIADPELKKIIQDLAMKVSKADSGLVDALESQRKEMRAMREEQGAKIAEALNAQFQLCVTLATVGVVLFLLSVPISLMLGPESVF